MTRSEIAFITSLIKENFEMDYNRGNIDFDLTEAGVKKAFNAARDRILAMFVDGEFAEDESKWRAWYAK